MFSKINYVDFRIIYHHKTIQNRWQSMGNVACHTNTINKMTKIIRKFILTKVLKSNQQNLNLKLNLNSRTLKFKFFKAYERRKLT